MTLDEATIKLTAISVNPCACNVCTHSARLARAALAQASPLGDKLLMMLDQHDTEEFRDTEKRFREDELIRLLGTLAYIARGRCIMSSAAPAPKTPAPPVQATIPTLSYDETSRSKLEKYRKARIEMKKNPRIPGSYWIKPHQRED